jgi:hypothetical protein
MNDHIIRFRVKRPLGLALSYIAYRIQGWHISSETSIALNGSEISCVGNTG